VDDAEDAPLSAEEAWLLRLDLGALTDREVAEIKRYYRAFKLPAPRDLEAIRELINRARDCKDIVHGWDDTNDFSMWKDVFKRLCARRTTVPNLGGAGLNQKSKNFALRKTSAL
jgi:hypothetical protein